MSAASGIRVIEAAEVVVLSTKIALEFAALQRRKALSAIIPM